MSHQPAAIATTLDLRAPQSICCAGCERPMVRYLYQVQTEDGDRRPACAECAFTAIRRQERVLRRGRVISPRTPWGRSPRMAG